MQTNDGFYVLNSFCYRFWCIIIGRMEGRLCRRGERRCAGANGSKGLVEWGGVLVRLGSLLAVNDKNLLFNDKKIL